MSDENVELVRRGFMATMEEDWPTALATLDPEVEVLDFDIPDAGVYRGPDGFLAWLQGWAEGWTAGGSRTSSFAMPATTRSSRFSS